MSRKTARESVMKGIFEMSINKNSMEETYDNLVEEIDIDKDQEIYVKELLNGITTKAEELDLIIEKYLINWKIQRLSKIDLAILRLCTYEILYRDDIPNRVTINEGIELAKKYSDEKSASFINGILDKISKNK